MISTVAENGPEKAWPPTTADLVRSYLRSAGDFRTAQEIAQGIGRTVWQVRIELKNQVQRNRILREAPAGRRPQRYRWVA
jgi:predicted transcriptional regulator